MFRVEDQLEASVEDAGQAGEPVEEEVGSSAIGHL